MKKLFITLAVSIISFNSEACSLYMTSQSMTGQPMGTACVTISDVRSDAIGTHREMELELVSDTGVLTREPTKAIRVGSTMVLMSRVVAPFGTLNIITMKATTMQSAVVTFLNGNTMTLNVDENGRVTPENICVRQEGITKVRGYADKCP
jgi:hypothetical protein